MKRRALFSSCTVIFLIVAFGVVGRGDESGKIELARLVELRRATRLLDEMTDSLGNDAPEVLDLRKRVEMSRTQMQEQAGELPDTDQMSHLLQILDNNEISDQHLRESVVTLTKEVLALRHRVAELERSTTARITFP